jgi:hypothetical protein
MRHLSGLPHVTDILARAGLIDASWFTIAGRDAGKAVHACTQLLDEGDLNWTTVDPVVVPRVRSYQRFLEEMNPEILAIEEPVYNEAFRYQGTLDRRLRIDGREAILDIKSPFKAPWQAIQVAAYAGCFDRPMNRYTLHLDDENYRLIGHHGRHDFKVFTAACTIAAWRERHAG